MSKPSLIWQSPGFPRAFGTVVAILALLSVVLILVYFRTVDFWYPILSIALFYAISVVISDDLNPLALAIGADGLLSVSKAQFLLWNAAVLFSYVWIWATRYHLTGHADALNIQRNVLVAMGFSVGTLVGAKGITVSYLGAGRISKPPQDGDSSLKDLVTQDDGTTPDLVKLQMLIWTLLAVVVFLIETLKNVGSTLLGTTPNPLAPTYLQLPNIDVTLMVLMGLGQAAYLGNKLTSSDQPVLTSLSPAGGVPGAQLTLTGSNLFGTACILLNGQASGAVVVVPAGATSLQFNVPTTLGPSPIVKGTCYQVGVNVDGVASANTLPMIVQ